MTPVPPIASADQPGARQPDLQAEADRDLTARSRHGYHVYPLLMVVLAASTPIFREHPALTWGTCGIIAAALLLRMVLSIAGLRLYDVDPGAWRIWFALTVSIVAGALGNLYGCVMLFYGYDSWTFALVMVWVTGAAAGSITTFTPSLRLGLLHTVALYLPPVTVAVWQHNTKSLSFAFAVILFLLFLVCNMRRLNGIYWKRMEDREREAARLRELQEARRSAEAASAAKSRFLADVSHEIRTPMHGVLGIADLLLFGPATPEQRRDLEMLRHSAQGLLAIVNDLLDLSKIEAGRLTLERQPIDLRQVLEEVRTILEPQARAKGLDLESQVAYGIPAAVYGDPVRLRQVLLNLTANAVKFTERGFVRVAIALEGHERSCAVMRFSVKDSGIGIPPDRQEAIFESFSQADGSITRRFGGTGLGLAISARIVELMGARIELHSEPGKGSTFAFSCCFDLADLAASPRPHIDAPAAAPLPALHVLLAEDNAVNQLVAVRLLHAAGHTVRVVDSGAAAVDAVLREPFDLVLMDNHMPGMNGDEATREIRRRGSRVPILAVTASAMVGDRERLLAAGMNGCITKPFRPEDLYAEMRRIVQRAAERTNPK